MTATSSVAAVRPFYWSLRRELWENRGIVVAPVVAAGVVVLGYAIGMTRPFLVNSNMSAETLVAATYGIASGVVMVTALFVAVFYCLGALYNERRDRSILFWKSLPVSDLTAVLAKAAIPLVVVPALSVVIVVATKLIMLAIGSALLDARGGDAAALWAVVDLPRDAPALVYAHAAQTLWTAPIWGWLLLVSAWAKRAPFLWAAGAPLAPCILERLAFGTSHAFDMLAERLTGVTSVAFSAGSAGHAAPGLSDADPGRFFSHPGLWGGLVVAAAFLAAAVWLRRRREPI